MPDTRLIERWLPIAEIGVESTRERTPMTPFPAPNRLHVWWARRPLVAARAAVLASLLPADVDRERFRHILGIHGDPVATRRRIDEARQRGERFEGQAYTYARAFSHVPGHDDLRWLRTVFGVDGTAALTVLDPTAGGGSIPLEALRLGARAFANDLNPVSALIMRATVEWPSVHGEALKTSFEELAGRFVRTREERLTPYFPAEPESNAISTNYLWARTVTCPYCDGLVPLSPNWRLAPDGTGVRLVPDCAGGPGKFGRVCAFKIVGSAEEQFPGTVARGDGHCPYADCGRVVDGDEIKRQAQAGQMGEQLFAVVYKRRVPGKVLKSGKRGRDKWVRGYRVPRPEDDNSAAIRERLAEKLPEWDALDIVPSERFPEISNDDRPIQYGMPFWRDLFSPRQLLCHGTSVEVFREMLDEDQAAGWLDNGRRAAYGYLALSLDTMLDYNNRASYWDTITGRGVRHIFNRHDFSFVWSYAEMAPLVVGVGYDWALDKTAKCIDELVALIHTDATGNVGDLLDAAEPKPVETNPPPPVTITCQPGDSLNHIADASIDAVVMDPPYYDNVQYAELSDFFYVWLKRTAGRVFPELFRRLLTDKENEAVANPAKFSGQRGARALAGRDYQGRMAAICRRVPPGAEAGRHHDADVHAQGNRGVGRAHLGPDGRRVRDHCVVADQHRGRGCSLHIKRQGRGQQHGPSRLPPATGHRPSRKPQLLGRRGAEGRWGCAQASRGVPGRRDRRGRSLPGGVRTGARGVLPPLAATARRTSGPASEAARTAETARRTVGCVRRVAGGCARRRPARSQALAAGAADPPEGERGSRPGHRVLRARVGHVPGTQLRLRRGTPLGARGRHRSRPKRKRTARPQVRQQPPAMGQRSPSG